MVEKDDADRALAVRGVYQFFKALETATTPDGKNALESFLTGCDQNNLTLGVSNALWSAGHTTWNSLIHIDARGPDCPACPGPPRL